jgi:E1A-binding protein p400
MASAVDSIAVMDDESASNTLKRRRSSSIVANETDIEQTPSKRVRSSSITNNSTSDNNNHIQTMYSSLNDIVQSHRNLVREYLDLQMCHRPDVSLDEQRFIQTEEDLIEKVEKNLHDINHIPSTPPSRNGKRQRYQSMNSTNQSFDRVKHETHILKRIDELKSDGKWTNQRLAKCLEPNKRKTHWDYLLDEMRWLAEDFLLEKRWKQTMAKKISLAVLKYFREKNQFENYQQREQIKFQRKQAQFISKEVMNFWKNISKISEDKETARLEELRKHQIDYNDNSTSSEEDIDDEETIELEEENEPDEYALYELEELQADQEESIDTILKRYYGIDLSDQSIQGEDNQLPSNDENDLPKSKELIENDKQLNDFLLTIQSFQPTGYTLNTTSVSIPVPFLLKYSLRDYQHVGLDWLVRFYDKKLNCILADETGLGKTIQTIALLAHLACEKGNWGPHLIIVPSNLMLNWQIEFKKWCPALKVFIDYGSIQDWTNVNACHIYITSYKLVLQNTKFFRWNKWKYLILDDVKDFQSELWQTLSSLDCEHRLLLTNSPIESRPLLKFFMPIFEFSQTLSEETKILDPFILRRLKLDVENQMPKKYSHILMCDLSERQRILYENIIPQEQDHSISLLMQLKRICNHPDLIESRSIISPLIFEKELIQYEIPQLIFDINFKNPYLAFDCASYDTFLSYRIQFTLQATKDMIMSRINTYTNNRDSNREKIQLTKDIIERYRNSSVWNQANEMSKSINR